MESVNRQKQASTPRILSQFSDRVETITPLDSEQMMKVVLRAAVDTTSVNAVTENTEDTPDRKTVMDWLHTLEKESMLDAVNDLPALLAMTVLDRDRPRTICIDFMDNPFPGIQTTKTSSAE